MVACPDERDPQDARSGRVVSAGVDDSRSEGPGFDLALRGLSAVICDGQILGLRRSPFDGADELYRRPVMVGREPA